eukprot:3947227-Karenia_brevis.AAC.1
MVRCIVMTQEVLYDEYLLALERIKTGKEVRSYAKHFSVMPKSCIFEVAGRLLQDCRNCDKLGVFATLGASE